MKKRWLGVLILCCLFFAGCANAVKEGTAYLEEGKIEEAREKFETSIEKEKDLDEAYRGLGICYWEKSDYTKAMAAFEKALGKGTGHQTITKIDDELCKCHFHIRCRRGN